MPSNKKAEKWLSKKRKIMEFWQVKRFLESLRLKYREIDKGKPSYCIMVPIFGIKFRFDGISGSEDFGWKVFFLDPEKLEVTPEYFREEVMWYLISKGYLRYVRMQSERTFKNFVITVGWGEKIIRKRIELCGNVPENNYMRSTMEGFLEIPMPKIISYFPCFFDYLF